MENYCERILGNSTDVSDQAFASLEATVVQQMSHIALSFDEFIHLQSKDRVSQDHIFLGFFD